MRNVRLRGADKSANSNGLSNAIQAAAAPARLFSVTCYNNTAGVIYLQCHDKASAAAEGDAPKLLVKILPDTTGGFDWSSARIFSNGIYICSSSTAATKTLGGASDAIIDATFSFD